MKKRILSLLLAICLVAVLLPTAAFATDPVYEDGIAKVSSEKELKDAIDEGKTKITLTSDIKLSKTLKWQDKEITLDLNGHVLGSGWQAITLTDTSAGGDTSLTLIDSNPDKVNTIGEMQYKGGVLWGQITLTVAVGGSHNCCLYANGGSVTGNVGLDSVESSIHCTSETPTVFCNNVGRWGQIYGGIFRGQYTNGIIYGGIFYGAYINTDEDVSYRKTYGGIFYGNNTIDRIAGKTVTFKYNDSTYAREVVSDKSVNKTAVAPIPPQEPDEYGYHIRWYLEGADFPYDFSTPVTEDITLTAKWENTYILTFDTADGTEINPIMLAYKAEVTAPESPTRTGYTFAGWDKVFPFNMPMEDITVTALWTPNVYNVTLNTKGGIIQEGNVKKYTYSVGATLPTKVTRFGYSFAGWYDNVDCMGDPVTEITTTDICNKIFYAAWIPVPVIPIYPLVSVIATYPPIIEDTVNGTVTVSSQTPRMGDMVTIMPKPDEGCKVDKITVTDRSGNPVAVRDNGDGTYSFAQPASTVTVSVTFAEIDSGVVDQVIKLAKFTDVPKSAYYYNAVQWAVENGVTEGTTVDGSLFSPNASCTRAQVVTFLWRAVGCPDPKSSANPFTDVKAGSYYEPAVLWAVENGITVGTNAEGTTFSPDAVCSCAQIMTFLWRALSTSATGTGADAYYTDAVQWAVKTGITLGTNAFSLDDACTRAQVVTFLWRALAE